MMQQFRGTLRARAAIARVVAVAAVLSLLSGCGVVGGWFDGKDQVGRLITSWSQGDYMEIDTLAPDGTLVLADDATRTEYLEAFPDELDTDAVRDVDLSQSFLVLGAYGKCMEQSRVWMDSARTTVWFEDFVARADRNTNCGWAPITIDVWQVPLAELGATPVGELSTGEPN